MPKTAPFVVQPELTAIAIAYANSPTDYIADLVMPRVKSVGKREFNYSVYGLEGFSRPDTRAGRKGALNEVTWGSSEKTASVEDYGLSDPIPRDDIDQGNKDGRNVTGESTEYIMGLVRLDRECRVASIVQDVNNYAADCVDVLENGGGVDNQDVDAEALIADALTKPWARPNIGIMSQRVWGLLARNIKLVEAIRGKLGGKKLTVEEFTSYFELQALHIGPARKNRAVKGQNPTLESVWGAHMSFLFRDLTATEKRGVTWGLTVPYGQPVAGSLELKPGDFGLRGGVKVYAGESIKELVLAPNAGCIIRNAISG